MDIFLLNMTLDDKKKQNKMPGHFKIEGTKNSIFKQSSAMQNTLQKWKTKDGPVTL